MCGWCLKHKMGIFEGKKTQEQYIAFSHSSKQVLTKEVALGSSLLDGRGIPHIYAAIQILISRISDITLRDKWKGNFDKNIEIIKGLARDVAAVQIFLSKYDYHKIKSLAIFDPEFVLYCKHMLNIYQNYDVFYDAYIELLKNPQVNSLIIPNNYWILFEQQYSQTAIVKQSEQNPLMKDKV